MEPKTEFKLGDIVDWCGVVGVVLSIDKGPPGGAKFPLNIYFKDSNDTHCFTLEGKEEAWHKTTSLKLIRRKAEKVKMYQAVYRTAYGAMGGGLFETIEAAQKEASVNFIGTIEVEVEMR